MLTAVRATYENGQIIWDEQPPVQKKTKVVVTFLEEDTLSQPNPAGGAVRLGSLKKRQGGSMKGQIHVPDDFNEPLDDLKDYM